MSGNPAFYTLSMPLVQVSLSGSDFIQSPNPRAALGAYIMQQAQILEINWGVKLWESGASGNVLTEVGAEYFTVTIPGLQNVVPNIFGSGQIFNPNWPDGPGMGTSAAITWMNQWDGTAFKAELEKWGETWHVAWNAITGVILFLFMLLCAGFSQVKWGNGDPGFVAGNVVFIIGTFAGLVWWPILMVEMIVLGYWIAHNMFWRNG